MTHVSKPNRRPIPGLADLVNGGSCPSSRKIRWLDERTARQALEQIGRHDPDADRLGVYQCARCGDWHVGHRGPVRDDESVDR